MAAVRTIAVTRGVEIAAAPRSYSRIALRSSRQIFVCAKKDIHPEWHESAPVLCNGEEVTQVSGTKAEYVVDIWSGNHPFFQGTRGNIIVDEGRLNKFMNRYGDMGSVSKVSEGGELSPEDLEKLKNSKKDGKKKKK